jgi:hypothetical protein
MSLARKARNVTHDPHDLRCQHRPYAKDPGEGSARRLHLLPDMLVQRGDLPIKGAHVAYQLGS